jgi:hypothetical protein
LPGQWYSDKALMALVGITSIRLFMRRPYFWIK